MRLIECEIACRGCGRLHVVKWENVPDTVYCESCKVRIASFKVTEYRGYIYILSNPLIIDQFKVGKTDRNPNDRAMELSSGTGVPAAYVVEAYFPSVDPDRDEVKTHQLLAHARTSPAREFFSTGFYKIYEACRSSTGFDPIMIRAPKIIELESYDPWGSSRRTPMVSSIKSAKRVALQTSNNFLCVDCGKPMRPVKKILSDRGIFRGCSGCGFFVDRSGNEMSPR